MARITVFGAGIFGLSAAWLLRERGADVAVVDPYGPGASASGGLVGALAPHVPERWNEKKAFQFESLHRAEAFWAAIAAASGCDPGYARHGRLQVLPDQGAVDLARARCAGATQHWAGRYEWRVVESGPYGAFAPSPTGLLAYDTLSARIAPRRAIAALAKALQMRDVPITADPPKQPGIALWATGAAGLDALSQALGQPVGSGVKGQAALFQIALPEDSPQLFVDGLHIVPHGHGHVALGSTTERDFDTPDRTDDALESLISRARQLCPAIAEAPVVARWAGLRPRARSRAPMMGPHPAKADAYILNGGFKIGFGMAPLAAEIMADLILDGRDRIPDSFRPEASLD